MTTDVAITLNWKGVKKSFEAPNVCSIVKGKNNSLTSLLLFESLQNMQGRLDQRGDNS
jgi:hypothetical protein